MRLVVASPKPATVLDVTDAPPAVQLRPLGWLGVAAVAAIVIHTCGYAFGVANQTTYLIEPLRRVHPELYTHDWFATATTQYHHAFAVVAAWLFRIDGEGALAIAVTHAVVMAATIAALAWMITGVTQRRVVVAFVLVTAWVLIDGDRSMAGSYLWAGYLQPSSLATLGWIVALGAFVRGRPLLAGIAAGAGGVFHANFLILGLGVFTLAELATSRSAKRVALLVVPQLVVLACLVPQLTSSAGAEDPDLALWILTRFHAPGHYLPRAVAHTLPTLCAWCALAIVVAPIAPSPRLATWGRIAGACSVLAVPLLAIPGLLPLTRLYVWRLAPFAQLAAMIVIALAAVTTIDDPARWRGRRWRAGIALALAAWLAWTTPGWAIAASTLGIVIAGRRLAPLVAIVALALAADVHRSTVLHPGLTLPGEHELYAWARAETPVDAVFLTPPRLGSFRLFARRAIVVDLKSPPLVPDELVAWYRRIADVTGLEHPHDVPEVNRAWDAASREELIARAHSLGAHYLVLDRPHDSAMLRGSIFADDRYIVYPVD